MAKDPAFLFYPGDWLGGTMYMTMQQRGCYITLLMLQFNTGPFTIAQAEQVLSICFASDWDMIKSKFNTDGIHYWNERLKNEKEVRQNFTNSRRINALSEKPKPKANKASAKHMHKHMEDENEDVNKDKNKGRDEKQKVVLPWESATFLIAWKQWKEYKQAEHNFKYKSPISEQGALKELSELSEGFEENAIKIISKSISKSWKGFFKLKDEDYAKRVIKTTKEHQSDIDEAASRYFGD